MGTFFPQTLRSRLRESGTSRWIPRTFALIAVQRQTAASRSTSPSMRVQQGSLGGVPIVTLRRPLSKSAQMPSFKASLGQVPDGLAVGLGGVHALDREKRRRLSERKRASIAVLLADILSN